MAEKFYNDNPTLADTVLFNLVTTDSSGTPINPYKVNNIIIYFVERGYSVDNMRQYDTAFGDTSLTQYFNDAVPVQTFGNADFPAWIGTDTSDAFITKLDYDDEGNPLVGTFQLQWIPTLVQEGDYFLCYTWTPIPAGDTLSASIQFYLSGNSQQTNSIPSHLTNPLKYPTLLERYLPEMFKMYLSVQGGDLTPDVLERMNEAIANGFVTVENLANKIVDLIDANAVGDFMLPYLGNLFDLKLKSNDTTLWRKQIKRAIPLYKKKGTISGLTEALANADIQFNKLTKLWQIVSSATWQDGFVVTEAQASQSTPIEFTLSRVIILPIDPLNFELYIRLAGSTEYVQLTSDYVNFSNVGTGEICNGVPLGQTIMTWVGENLSVSPIILSAGDVVRVVYEFAVPVDQSIEDYIRTLPLADQRDETSVTYPLKNWNVRLIAEDDPMFDAVIPARHPFHYPVVFGHIRTEFPFSENIYNMEEYNGSTRDSLNPCDLDKTFLDSCSACLSSKFTIDIEIEDLSAERLEEAEAIITDFVPFHAVVQSINYVGSKNEFVAAPQEDIEILLQHDHVDNVIETQMSFNRLIEDGASDANELKRNMLASYSGTAASGTGVNSAIVMFSPGVRFDTLGIGTNNYLEILSGTDQGEYQVQVSQRFTVDIVQGMPDTISWPLDTSSFPYRLSNLLYSESSVSIYQDDIYKFSDPDIMFITYGVEEGWFIQITSGPYTGLYEVLSVNSDNTLTLDGFPTITASGLSYNLRTDTNAIRHTGTTGAVATTRRGRAEISLFAQELGFRIGDYLKYSGIQYVISGVAPRAIGVMVDKVYIDGYTGGDVVGTANIFVYRRLVDSGIGYLSFRGMELTGPVPTVDYSLENDLFLENYLIQIGLNYYQIASIDGGTMVLNGPLLAWGLSGTSVSYTILHFTKTSPITSQAGLYQGDAHVFDRLDRRGQDSYVIETETEMGMAMQAMLLNDINSEKQLEFVGQQESIWFDIEYRS